MTVPSDNPAASSLGPAIAGASPPPARRNRRSAKFLQIVLLLVVTLIAGLPVSGIIGERSDRQAEMQEELARSWSPEQTVRTPVLAVPYLAADGKTRGYLKIVPATLATQAALAPERKKRGLFSATVYTAALEMTGSFAVPSASSLEKLVGRGGSISWQDSVFLLQLSGLAGMTTEDRVVWNGETIPWRGCHELVARAEDCWGAALAARPTIAAAPAASVEMKFQATVTLRGTGAFHQTLDGRQATAAIKAPWPTPSFVGTVLPSDPTVTADAFEARWTVSDYSRPPLRSDAALLDSAEAQYLPSVGVELLEAVPTYRMINRASKYASLFVVLSFTVYGLFELLSSVRIHIVQYGLLGLSMTLFSLLLVSFAEPFGYVAGYWISAALVLVQATAYTAAVTRRARSTLVFAAALASLFAFLHLLIGLENYSLLVGTIALFLVLSAVMAVTQRVDWQGDES
ncbi:cell envelope integrity protein CreD [Azospirillum sp. 11R-A]|uniref:cell envelope integrity protein CreD n=1 Tax=Azospirillum sp. 11R-A TaxID=3111634 RepID=UPI003C268B67